MSLPIIIRAAVAFAAAAVTMSTTLNAAITYPIEVPFFQAAIFFMTGKEPPNDVTFESAKKAMVKDAVLVPNKGLSSHAMPRLSLQDTGIADELLGRAIVGRKIIERVGNDQRS
jgi:hypothetical protein